MPAIPPARRDLDAGGEGARRLPGELAVVAAALAQLPEGVLDDARGRDRAERVGVERAPSPGGDRLRVVGREARGEWRWRLES